MSSAEQDCKFARNGAASTFKTDTSSGEDDSSPELRRLSQILESRLKKLLRDVKSETKDRTRRQQGGIKLFRDSGGYVEEAAAAVVVRRKEIKRRQVEADSYDDDETKAKTVAVDGLDVLNKKDVRFWSNRSKAQVFRYRKSNNGRYVIQLH